VGNYAAALDATQEAVDILRGLVASEAEVFLAELALSLQNLSSDRRAIGDRDGALAAAREALTHHCNLAVRFPSRFGAALQASIPSLRAHLADFGSDSDSDCDVVRALSTLAAVSGLRDSTQGSA
jgi:hypothetical protein